MNYSDEYENGEYCETKYENYGGTEIIINARNCPGSLRAVRKELPFPRAT